MRYLVVELWFKHLADLRASDLPVYEVLNAGEPLRNVMAVTPASGAALIVRRLWNVLYSECIVELLDVRGETVTGVVGLDASGRVGANERSRTVPGGERQDDNC